MSAPDLTPPGTSCFGTALTSASLVDPTQWHAPFWVVVAALFVIVQFRANATYWVGRLASAGARRTRLARLTSAPGYQKACERIDRFGAPVIVLSFLTIGFQTLANLAAGASGMKLRHYLPAVAIGGVAWALLYATLGLVGFELVARLFAYSPVAAIVLLVVVAGAIVAYLTVQLRRRPQVVAD